MKYRKSTQISRQQRRAQARKKTKTQQVQQGAFVRCDFPISELQADLSAQWNRPVTLEEIHQAISELNAEGFLDITIVEGRCVGKAFARKQKR